jgi:hypothetical protein
MPTWDGAAFTHEAKLALDGTFELPPIARVAQLRLFAEHAGQAVLPAIKFAPEYGGDNTLQILFRP